MDQLLRVKPRAGHDPQESTGSSSNPSSSSSSSPLFDDELMSTCSESCPDCREEHEGNEACIDPCHGFIDCDDAEPCTRSDCADVDECRDVAPPCLNRNCLQASIKRQKADVDRYMYGPFLGTSGMDDDEAEDSLQKHDLQYPSANPIDKSRISPPSIFAPMSSSKDGTSMDVDSCYIVHCLWGTDCEEEFGDWGALDEHIYHTHIKSQNQVKCKWDDCEQATDHNQIVDHVKTDHSPPFGEEDGDQKTYHWSGCRSTLRPSLSGLEEHIESMHVPGERQLVECQWDSCGVMMEDPTDLSLHLQTEHFPEPLFKATLPSHLSANKRRTSSSSHQGGTYLRTCRWVITVKNEDGGEEEALCDSQFSDAASLQQHIKEAHLMNLSKRTGGGGFVCRWEGCPREETQPFKNKTKLESHMQVHTG
ncbi:MAG: zinc-finger protein, partial [Peltula sp. TS41687]